MNFFGHATVAAWIDAEPRWVLGAMLPDFVSMCRARLAGAADELVSAGIAFHHRTDEAFHGAPTFVELSERGARDLEQAGLGRGPSRAVAHVGTELLIDGLLLDAGAAPIYLDAVALAPRTELRFAQGAERFATLAERVAGFGLPNDYRSPDRVVVRLEQALSRRPRLAIGEDDRRIVVPFLAETQRALSDRLDILLDEVEAGLVDTARSPRAILRRT